MAQAHTVDIGPGETQPRRDGAVTLPDGRTLSYAEYGDPSGPPVLYFHGYPSSRLEPGLGPIDGVRLIAPDRPGYGGSDPLPHRRLLDWPLDIAAFMDRLGIAKAGVFGMSGGGPFAAVCAHALPDRVGAAALVSAMGPPGEGWEVGGSAAFVMNYGARRLLFGLIAATFRWRVLRGTVEDVAALLRTRYMLSPGDSRALDGELGPHMIRSVREGLRRSTRGAVADAMIYTAPWGFDLSTIRVPVSIWHGTGDRTVPVGAAHTYARRIPHATLRLFDGDGHFDMVAREKVNILHEITAWAR